MNVGSKKPLNVGTLARTTKRKLRKLQAASAANLVGSIDRSDHALFVANDSHILYLTRNISNTPAE